MGARDRCPPGRLTDAPILLLHDVSPEGLEEVRGMSSRTPHTLSKANIRQLALHMAQNMTSNGRRLDPYALAQHLWKQTRRCMLCEKPGYVFGFYFPGEYSDPVIRSGLKDGQGRFLAYSFCVKCSYPYAADDLENAQIRALRRSAYDDVYNSLYLLEPEEARQELERLLTRAERTQDPELADAVYHVATERGEGTVADAYLQKRPKANQRWEKFLAARRPTASIASSTTRWPTG